MHPRRTPRILIGVFAATLIMAGCGDSKSNTDTAGQAAQPLQGVDTGALPAPSGTADVPVVSPGAVVPGTAVSPDAAATTAAAPGKKKAGAGAAKVAGAADKPIDLTGPRTASDVGVTPDSIKVGQIGIYSGPVHGVGQDIGWAGQAVLRWYNDNGGINGRKLDVLVRDDAWDATKG